MVSERSTFIELTRTSGCKYVESPKGRAKRLTVSCVYRLAVAVG